MGSCLGATDVPKLARTDGDVALLGRPSRGTDRATEESNPRRSARSASPSARVASLLAAPVLFASCVRRFDTTPGSVLSALGGSRRNDGAGWVALRVHDDGERVSSGTSASVWVYKRHQTLLAENRGSHQIPQRHVT
jgi:hypothetical protein